MDLAELNISECFSEGQAYVALSRVRTLDGLSLKSFSAAAVSIVKYPLSHIKICANATVLEFYGIAPTNQNRTVSRAASFQLWRSRSETPDKKGQKALPEGKPRCLHGKVRSISYHIHTQVFIITGVLESLERQEAEDLIKKYGGYEYAILLAYTPEKCPRLRSRVLHML